MKEKEIFGRMQQKHDIEANWIKAVNFVPIQGEIIVYDIEVNELGETLDLTGTGRIEPYTHERFKIGDGITKVSELPFIANVIQNGEGEQSIQHSTASAKGDYSFAQGESVALGTRDTALNKSIAGCLGYYYQAIDFTNKKIYLSKEQIVPELNAQDYSIYEDDTFMTPTYTVGEKIRIINDGLYDGDATIVSMQNNIVEYTGNLGFTKLDNSNDTDPYAYTFSVPNEPTIGIVAVSYDSFASGRRTKAVGAGSFVTGIDAKAIGIGSFASGNMTQALGQNSHAEGYNTVASKANAHAEGSGTTASGMNSHAEGQGAKATGDVSHAEGNSEATNQLAHAEGYGSKAEGMASHAEGGFTIARGQGAHAEGSSTLASGKFSHAQGNGTIAASENQDTQGRFNIEDSKEKYAHITGNGIDKNNRSNAYTLDWEGNAHFAGDIYIDTEWSKETGEVISTKRLSANLQEGEGENTLVQAGSTNQAITEYAVAFGKNNVAGSKGFYIKDIDFANKVISLSNDKDGKDENVDTTDYAAGDDISIIAKVNRGTEEKPSPKEEHWHYCAKIVSAKGNKVTYDVDLPFTLLADTNEEEFHTFAVPKKPHVGSKIIGIRAFAAGGNANFASGQDSFAEGRGNVAAGKYAHAEGRASIAGYSAHAEGMTTKALSMYSHAEGESTISTGKAAHAEGGATTATAQYSHAEGLQSHAEASSSHVEGIGNRVKGSGSHAEGYGNKIFENATYSHAEGRYNIVSSQDQHVQGRANIEDTNNDYADIVGNGAINNENSAVLSRSNAYTLDWEGNGRFAGDVYVHGSLKDSANAKKLVTEDYVYSKDEADAKFINTEAINPNVLSNSIRGTAFGNKEITLEDISNLSHNIDVNLSVTEEGILPQKILAYSGNLIGVSKDPTRSNYRTLESSRMEILDKDNSIKVEFTNHYYAGIDFTDETLLEIFNSNIGKNFTFSIKEGHPDHRIDIVYRTVQAADRTIYGTKGENSITFSIPEEITKLTIRPVARGKGDASRIVEEMQLRIGSEVKPYIPYVSNTLYAVNSDGTVDNVSSIYPTTTILALTDNDVTINATYNKDINTVISDIETELNNKVNKEDIENLEVSGYIWEQYEVDLSTTLYNYSVRLNTYSTETGELLYSKVENYTNIAKFYELGTYDGFRGFEDVQIIGTVEVLSREIAQMPKTTFTGRYIINNNIDYLPENGYNEIDGYWYVRITDSLATEEYVDNKVASLVDSAPETLDTLKELSKALNDDENFAATITNEIATKADKEHTHLYAGSSKAGGAANSAIKLENSRTFAAHGAVTSNAINFDGTSNISIPINSVKESYLSWGGKNLSGQVSPLDAALIDELGANRLAYINPNDIIIEYSRDGGATWLDYEAKDTDKTNLTTIYQATSFMIGKYTDGENVTTDWKIRVTIVANSFYFLASKAAINISSQGAGNCTVDVERTKIIRNEDGTISETDFETLLTQANVSGWSGWNILNFPSFSFGSTNNGNTKRLRFIFNIGTLSSTHANNLRVFNIFMYGSTSWSAASNLGKNGHLYSFDNAQNATFPAKVKAKEFVENGKILSEIYATKNDLSNFANEMFDDISASVSGVNFIITKDVSPIEHEIKVKASSKNLLDIVNTPEMYLNGYTWEKTETGFIATCSQDINDCWLRHGFNLGKSEDWKGKTITVSADYKTTTNGTPVLMIANANTQSGNVSDSNIHKTVSLGTIKGTTLTVTIPNNLQYEYVCVIFYFTNGAPMKIGDTVEYSNIQIEEDTVATAYTPFVDVSAATIKKYGKNLLDIDAGLNECLKKNADGSYTLTKISTGQKRFSTYIPFDIIANKFSLYAEVIDTNIENLNGIIPLVFHYDNKDQAFTAAMRNNGNIYSSGSKDLGFVRLYIQNTLEDGAYITFKNPQIVVSDIPVTEYEPYVELTEYPISTNGNVENVMSIYPNTVLVSNINGILLEAQYLTNNYVNVIDEHIENKIEQAIIKINKSTKVLYSANWEETYETLANFYTFIYYTDIDYYIDLDNDSPDNYTIIFDIAANATLEQRKAAESACLYGEFRDMANNVEGNTWRYSLVIGCTSDTAPSVDIPIEVVVMR